MTHFQMKWKLLRLHQWTFRIAGSWTPPHPNICHRASTSPSLAWAANWKVIKTWILRNIFDLLAIVILLSHPKHILIYELYTEYLDIISQILFGLLRYFDWLEIWKFNLELSIKWSLVLKQLSGNGKSQ